MGGRLLKRWLALPLKNVEKIHYRHELVKYCIENDDFLEIIQYQLQQISDIERLISKAATAKISPRETVLLKNSLKAILPIKEKALASKNKSIKKLGDQFLDCSNIISKIDTTLFENSPVSINKGGAIADGVSKELDDLRAISSSVKEYLDNMLARESERTSIPSLKIAFNNVF